MIKSSFEVTVHAISYRKALALVEQIVMQYLDINDLDTLYSVADIEMKHKVVGEITALSDFIGFDVTAYVKLTKPYVIDK